MAEQRSKSNKKFMLLSALGIFMVVDSHTFTCFDLFGNFIPYNSFFMPMFVFISGYFNKVDNKTNLLKYTWKKIRTLLFPYIGLTFLVFVIQWLMNWFKEGEIVPSPPGYFKYMLENAVTSGAAFPLTTPTWFVITLFATLMFYAVLKKLLSRFWNSFVAFALFTGLHLFSVYAGINANPEAMYPLLLPFKVMFFLPFLELGIIYRDHLEKPHTSLSGGLKLGLMALMLLINAVRTMYLPMPYDVAFDNIPEMNGFTSPFIVTPMISSLVGITFWLTFVDLIGKPLHESRFVNYMSCNTFWIMGLHITFFNIVNCILMAIHLNIIELPYFDVEYFRGSEWYYWEISVNFKIVYVLAGVLGPLGLKWIFDKIVAGVMKLSGMIFKREKPAKA